MVWNEAVVEGGGQGLEADELLAFHFFLRLGEDFNRCEPTPDPSRRGRGMNLADVNPGQLPLCGIVRGYYLFVPLGLHIARARQRNFLTQEKAQKSQGSTGIRKNSPWAIADSEGAASVGARWIFIILY